MPEAGLELLDVRVSFLGVEDGSDRVKVGGYPGILCAEEWPLRGFGPTYPIEGIDVKPGDQFAVIYYLRIKEPGRHKVLGTRFSFSSGGEVFQQVMEDTTFIAIGASDKRAQPCPGEISGMWTGNG